MQHIRRPALPAREVGDPSYDEFVRVPALSAGTYVVPAGAVDGQQPHREDEVYVVLRGSGRFTGAGSTVDIGPGSVLFVPAFEEHRFHHVTETLEVVVVFGPAETAPA